jgi:L-ascorbate metabolism protein UlaG (beta-lactamase superfamily)
MIVFLLILLSLIIIVVVFINQPKFGKLPSGERLATIKKSPNYKNGAFQNINNTPSLAEGETYYKVLKTYLFADKSKAKPTKVLPAVKTDLLQLDKSRDVLVWFGHSSYFLQVDGKRILVDPVLSGSASPIPGGTKSFEGSDIYTADDLPPIDYLFITHDHWDHLDYKTILALKEKVTTVICGLGTGAHLEYWGYNKKCIIEKDWNETFNLDEGFEVNTVPARHFAGRSFWRNKAIWMSYVLKTPAYNFFIGGDSGYDTHFADIGAKFGPFDLAILENGQYNNSWKYIHMMPGEHLQAALDLRAKKLLPVHSSKFNLSLHAWDEPLKNITTNNDTGVEIITPMIGEPVWLDVASQTFKKWWEDVR